MRRADCVAAPTRHDAQVLLQRWGARRQGVEVIPPGGDHILRAAPDRGVFRRLALAGRRYVLALEAAGADEVPGALMQLLARSGDAAVASTQLVTCGLQGLPAGAAPELPGRQHAGATTDAERRALYEGAACLLLTRFDDHTLLAALEAMSCGCAVVGLQQGALAEVCAEAALYFDAAEPATLGEQVQRVLASTHVAQGLRAAGYARARSRTWDASAQIFSALGQRLAERHP
jgi:glycosyltransferase involved in cell wall biosynthesis